MLSKSSNGNAVFLPLSRVMAEVHSGTWKCGVSYMHCWKIYTITTPARGHRYRAHDSYR